MRWRRADLGRRVNGNLELRFGRDGLTSYAGLELVRRYLVSLRVVALLRRELGQTMPHSDFGAARMVLLVLALIISGGRRLRHILFVAEDPVVLRLCGLTRMPTPRTVGRWLGEIRATHLPALQRINGLIAARAIRAAGLRRLTIDVDGSVVSTGLQVEWAQRGFNPHRRKVPSYYPITAYEAQSGQVLRVQNRPGNVHDGKASQGFLRDLFAQIESTLGAGYLLEFRMDGAYFRREIIDLLDRRGAEYAIKVRGTREGGCRRSASPVSRKGSGGAVVPLPIRVEAVVAGSWRGRPERKSISPSGSTVPSERKGEEEDAGRIDVLTPLC